MVAPTCVVCERPTPDGEACVPCAIDRPRQLLAEITDMLGAATMDERNVRTVGQLTDLEIEALLAGTDE